MRIPGTTFSDSYNTITKVTKALPDNKSLENHLLKWASDVVDTMREMNKDGWFKVIITMNPNLHNIKGVDEVKIDVWQTQNQNDEGFRPYVKLSARHSTISECVAEINERLDYLTKVVADGIIELNGKKFKLVEVK